jgi:hypothetical protein
LLGRVEVDVVHADAGAPDDLQARGGRVERRRVDLRSTSDDPRVHLPEGCHVVEDHFGLFPQPR